MTCKHCCDANIHFDRKTAVKQMKTYRRKGPTGTTKKIVTILDKIDLAGKQLLDIGGGIGVLQWHFLNKGGRSTQMVDASKGYLQEAQEYAKENGWEDVTTFVEGDFNDHVDKVENANVVSLDKVVCCYPDYELILSNAIMKSKEYLVLSYPISNWVSISMNKVLRLFTFFKKSDFRSYVHPVSEIRKLITDHNLVLRDSSRTFPWIIELYQIQK